MVRKLILLALCLIIITTTGCVVTGLDNDRIGPLYTTDIYLGDYSIARELDDGSGGYWHEYSLGAIDLSPGGSGATLIAPNASSLGGYRFDNITEYLLFATHVDADWDEVSDGILEIAFEVNVDNTGGLVTDTVEISAECWHKLPGELVNTVNSHEGSTVVGQSDQHELFIQEVDITDLRIGEVIAFRINLNTVFSEVDNIIINYVEFKYKTYIPAMESS
jgi:hypothetical protein